MATYSNSTSIAVSSAATGGATVGSSSYAVVTYILSTPGVATTATNLLTATYGPGQTIQSTVSVTGGVSYSFFSGVVFINSP